MFLLRGVAVSLSIGVIVYVCLSMAVLLAWRVVRPDALRYSAKSLADLLFALRLFPMLVSAAVMLLLAVPSFLWLEPRAVTEPIGLVPVAVSLCGLAGIAWGIWNGASALHRALRTVANWANAASVISSAPAGFEGSVPLLRSLSVSPPLAVAGIVRPAVWVSQTAEFLLSEGELTSALRHEMVHVLRKDNLRKLIFRVLAFPGMAKLESAWCEATEMAADEAAVSNRSEALNLAAAVIKLSRCTPLESPGELTTALVHSPIESVNARVERLLRWKEIEQNHATSYGSEYAFCTVAALVVTLAVTYTHLLIFVHAATELLVR
jgi:hypothetical protein